MIRKSVNYDFPYSFAYNLGKLFYKIFLTPKNVYFIIWKNKNHTYVFPYLEKMISEVYKHIWMHYLLMWFKIVEDFKTISLYCVNLIWMISL